MTENIISFVLYTLECVFVTGLLIVIVAGAVSAYAYFKEM